VQALLEACRYCEDPAHRRELAELLSQSQYVGTDVATILPGFLEAYDRGTGSPAAVPEFNRFFGPEVNEPHAGDAVWILSQLGRWGLTSFPSNWQDVVDRVQDRELFQSAAAALGLPAPARPEAPIERMAGERFDPVDPLGYLDRLAVKGQVRVASLPLPPPPHQRPPVPAPC
jgi:nitrate/nitrite transport system ATP-binding protein